MTTKEPAAMRTILTSVDEVVETLGGTVKCARLTGSSFSAVSNWRAKGRMPADLYRSMSQALLRRECIAPPGLWSQRELVA